MSDDIPDGLAGPSPLLGSGSFLIVINDSALCDRDLPLSFPSSLFSQSTCSVLADGEPLSLRDATIAGRPDRGNAMAAAAGGTTARKLIVVVLMTKKRPRAFRRWVPDGRRHRGQH